MAVEIGVIKAIIGKVELIDSEETKPLKVGDKVFSDQVISTAIAGAVEIEFIDGSVMALPQNSQAVLDKETFDPTESSQSEDITALQDALLAGADPTENEEATAANAGAQSGEDEGSSTAQVLYEQPVITPESGFETSFFSEEADEELFTPGVDFLGTDEFPVEPEPPVDNDIPSILVSQSSDDSSEFTMTNHDEVSSAGYHNSYGYYVKTLDADGNVISDTPTIGVIIETDVHFKHGGFTDAKTVTGYDIEQIGFFIIPDGGNRFATFEDGVAVTFQFVNGQWRAFSDSGAITGRGSHVLFDNGEFNKDGQDHVINNKLAGNQNWEDLQIPNGDGDYNDVNTNVDWTKVTVSGDVVDSVSFGDDTPGAVDFSLSDNIVMNGSFTSNGKAIEFTARDTDNDNHNDQIVGSTEDGEILTIDGLLDGEYSVNVLGPIDDDAGDATVDLQANVSATDGDGDESNVILNINLNIDTNQVLDSVLTPVPDL